MKKLRKIVTTMDKYKRTDEIKGTVTMTVDKETDSFVMPDENVDEELVSILAPEEPVNSMTVMSFTQFVNENYPCCHNEYRRDTSYLDEDENLDEEE